jgi:hypothetical protein
MGLGLSVSSGSSGDRKPIVKYDARAGRMHRIDRQDGVNNPVEVTNGFTAVFDLANIEVGYARFNAGGAPEWAMVKIGQPLPAKPAPDFKQAFRCNIKLNSKIGGDVREFASAAGCVIQAMDSLYDAYSAAPERSQGKLPVVALTGTTMITSGSGAQKSTNYAPNFAITNWLARPADLGAASAPAPMTVVPPPMSRPTTGPVPPQGNGNGHADMNDDIPF